MKNITQEALAEAVAASHSVAEVCRRIGVRCFGSTNTTVKNRVAALGLDTSHFTGKRSNRGPGHKGGPAKLRPEEVLVHGRRDYREDLDRLRWALDESNVVQKCASCDQGQTWQGRPLRLQVDHINGNPVDDRLENLR